MITLLPAAPNGTIFSLTSILRDNLAMLRTKPAKFEGYLALLEQITVLLTEVRQADVLPSFYQYLAILFPLKMSS